MRVEITIMVRNNLWNFAELLQISSFQAKLLSTFKFFFGFKLWLALLAMMSVGGKLE